MKFGKRLLSLLLCLVCLAPTLLAAIPVQASSEPAPASQTSTQGYTKKKVVSVLYDTSGSMQNEKRAEYARYASQTLMAMLGSEDKLFFVPMHKRTGVSGSVVIDQSNYNKEGVYEEVVLSDSVLREEAIANALNNVMFSEKPVGSNTPASSIEWAVQLLKDKGMKKTSEINAGVESDTEYFLVILTDGAFEEESNPDEVSKLVLKNVDPSLYDSFRCIYLGFSAGAIDLGNTAFNTEHGNVKTIKAATPEDVVKGMQDVANLISGRYSIDASRFSRLGNQVIVDLEGIEYGLRSVSMLLQNSDAKLLSASYNGETLDIAQRASFSADGLPSMKGGSSAVLKRRGNDLNFSQGSLTLEFDSLTDEDLKGLSILLEPALSLRAYATHKGQSVNDADITKLKAGDELVIGYELLEEGSDAIVSVPGAPVAEIMYNNTTYAVGEPIPLVEGKLVLSLTVSILNGSYTLYTSIFCNVRANPDSFKVEAEKTVLEPGAAHKSKTLFAITDGEIVDTNSELSYYDYDVTVTAADGTPLPSSVYTVAPENGKIAVSLDTEGYEYGIYSISVLVYRDGAPRDCTAGVPYYPADVLLSPVGDDNISMTLYGLSQNAQNGHKLTFALSTEGRPLPFGEGVLKYKVTLNGEDVTAACVVDGNNLSFFPTAETLGAFGTKAGSGRLHIMVYSDIATYINASAEATITLTDTVFEIRPLEQKDGAIDRFALGKNQSSVRFAVYRDGVPLSEAELQEALDSGSFSVDDSSFGANAFTRFFTPLGGEVTVETVDNVPVVRIRIVPDQWGIFRFFTSMLVSGGDKTMSVRYQSASGERLGSDVYTIAPAGIAGYILRIAILIAIIYLIIFAIESMRCIRFEKGSFVKMKIETNGKNKGKVTRVQSIKHMGGFPRNLMLGRLVPIIGLKHRTQQTSFEGNHVDAEKYAMTLPSTVKMQIRPQTDEKTNECMNALKAKVREAYRTGSASVPKLPDAKAQMFWESESLDIKFIKTAQLKSGIFIVSKESTDFIEVIFYVSFGK